MRWSKGWFTLVTIAAALAAGATLLLPHVLQGEVDRQVQMRLAAAEHGAEAMLKLHARRWLDACARAATDGTLGEALEASSHGASNPELLHQTAQERLRAFNSQWKAREVIAVDVKRRVLARAALPGAGSDEQVWGDDLSDAQVVGEALRGYVLDDTWVVAGQVLRVAAAPVVVRDRYAGALLVVIDMGSELAGPLREMLGADLAFVVGDKVIAGNADSALLDNAPALLKQHARDLAAAGRIDPLPIGPSGRYAIAAVALPGEAAAQQAALVLLSERPRLASVAALWAHVDPAELPWRNLLPVGAGLVAVLLLGWFLFGREHDARIERLLQAVQVAARGDRRRIDDTRFDGRLGTLARTINAAIDKAGRSVTPLLQDVGVALEPTPSTPTRAPRPGLAVGEKGRPAPIAPAFAPSAPALIDLPPAPSLSAPLAATSVQRPAPSSFSAAAAPQPIPIPAPEPAYSAPAHGSSLADARPSSPPPDTLIGGPPAALTAGGLAHGPMRGFGGPLDPLSPPSIGAASPASAMLASLDEVSGVHPVTGATRPRQPLTSPARGDDRDGAAARTMIAPPEPMAPATEAEFDAIFHDFIDTRQRCGEPVEGVTYEKFAARLREQRAQLTTRYGCKGVRFHVYVKDGRAAIKATPVNV